MNIRQEAAKNFAGRIYKILFGSFLPGINSGAEIQRKIHDLIVQSEARALDQFATKWILNNGYDKQGVCASLRLEADSVRLESMEQPIPSYKKDKK